MAFVSHLLSPEDGHGQIEERIRSSYKCVVASPLQRETLRGPVLPRLVSVDGESGLRQVVAFCSSRLECLQLFRLGLGGQLLPVPLPAAGEGEKGVIVETQSFLPQLFFSFLSVDADDELSIVIANVKGPLASDATQDSQRFSLKMTDERTALVETFGEESFVEVECFSTEFAEMLRTRLTDLAKREEVLVGPVDYCQYGTLDLADQQLQPLLRTLWGEHFYSWLRETTGLPLAGMVHMEVRHVTPGCYQIFNDRYGELHGLDVVITLCSNEMASPTSDRVDRDGGCWIYLVDGEEVARIVPRHNTMALAYRVEGCHRFMALVGEEATEEEDMMDCYQLLMTFKVNETES